MSSESVRVCVRCRPFSQRELADGHSNIASLDGNAASVTIRDPTARTSDDMGKKTFTFDAVFGEDSQQMSVYNATARPIVDSVLDGYNGTVFAYGQTGTGKTFSMEGVRTTPHLRGIIPNAFEHIFAHITSAPPSTRYLVRASALEIYNEDIRDLLNPKAGAGKLEIKEHSDTGVYVRDLSTFVVKDVNEIDKLLNIANKNRSVGATAMNERSSRSHSIFSVTVERSDVEQDGSEHIRVGKLHLVDLAGSERQSKTQASGDRLKEATKINLSLSALGNVISSLVDGKSSHVPYRDSKLTRLLQDSLGGSAKTVMLATMSPASYNYEETISTLRYANRAKNIKNKPKINEDPKDAMLRQFQEEILKLKQQLEAIGPDCAQEPRIIEEVVEQVVEESDSDPGEGAEDGDKMNAKQQTMRSATQKRKSRPSAAKPKSSSGTTDPVIASAIDTERTQKSQLEQQLALLQSKLLRGGVSILDTSRVQAQQIAVQEAEMEKRRERQRELERKVMDRERDVMRVEEEYASLQEERDAKTKKIAALWKVLQDLRGQTRDRREQWARERDELEEQVRQLRRENALRDLVLDMCVDSSDLDAVRSAAAWDEERGGWRIRGQKFSGNNLRGNTLGFGVGGGGLVGSNHLVDDVEVWDPACVFKDVYLTYESLERENVSPAARSASRSSGASGSGSRKVSFSGSEGRKSSFGKPKNSSTNEPAVEVPKARGLVETKRHYA
ncbi:Kinesin-like protein kif3a [Gonapodya sp. JEL0774]|nr:Kinesin-like protein kif3a [Gonapodya sp. JEL0774]